MSLAVESGRYFVNQRFSCCGILLILQGIKVEDEVYLLIHCPSYKFASQKYSSVHMNSSNIDDIQRSQNPDSLLNAKINLHLLDQGVVV